MHSLTNYLAGPGPRKINLGKQKILKLKLAFSFVSLLFWMNLATVTLLLTQVIDKLFYITAESNLTRGRTVRSFSVERAREAVWRMQG